MECQLPTSGLRQLDGVGELSRELHRPRLVVRSDQSSRLWAWSDAGESESAPRTACAEPGGRAVLRQRTGGARRRDVELPRAVAAGPAPPRNRILAASELHDLAVHDGSLEQRARR